MLTIQSLHCSYGTAPVVADASFGVKPGELVAVVGRNGSGKSTLLRAVMGLAPSEGEVFVGDGHVTGCPDGRVRTHGFAYMPQEDRVILSLSVRQNIQLAASRQPALLRRQVEDWLNDCEGGDGSSSGENVRAGLGRLAEVLTPLVRRPADRLSGGEAAAVGLACTLIAGRSYLFIDELSAGTAPGLLDIFADVLRDAVSSDGVGVLFAEQDHNFVLRVATRVLWLNGQNEQQGAVVVEVQPEALSAFRREPNRSCDLVSSLEESFVP